MMKISTRSIASLRIAILVCLLQILAGFSEVYAQCWNSGWSGSAYQYHGALTSCSNTTIRSGNLASTCYNQWDCVYGTNYTFTASGGFVGGGTVWTYFEYTGSAWQARLNGTGGTANITSTINSPSGSGWGLIVFYYNSSCPPTWNAGSATLQYRVNSQASPTINNSSTITVCAGSPASYSVSGNCNYPLTRTAGPASGAAAALGNTTVTHATQYARGDGGYFWWNPGATNQQIALAACEATYGAGNCSAGSCGYFTYYYRTAAGSCNCAKAVGELEFIYSNTGYTTIGQDYGGGPATVPTISGSATSGAGPFVRRKGWADCSQPSTWQLVQPNLRSYGGTTASFTITGLPAASAGTVTAGTTPQCIGGSTTYTVSGVELGGGSGAWSSSNGSIATVNPSTGVVTAVSAGTCNIIYTVTGGCGGTKTASKPYTVTPTASAGTVTAGTTPQCIGGTTTYTVSGVELGGGSGAWSSSNGSIATVNPSTGVVTAVSAGTCNIIYTVTGGCGGTKTASKPYTVTANNTIAAGVNRTTCINTPITSISLATTGATGATFSGLPSGVTGSWSANVATISGTPTVSGTFNYTVTMTGGCTGGTNTATGTITVNPNNTIAAGVNRTTCINTAITSISLATTGATGATFSGLPSGVTGSWSANVATISGTPTVSGTFNYTVTMTGGCTGGTNTATGTITVNPNNTIAAGVNRTTCINTAITSISLATTGATGATFSGLPSGVTGSWSANVATISGTPTASGTFNYTVTMTGGCTGGTNTATGTITVNPNNTIAAGENRTTCINTAITSISLATTGATGATFSGLPAGVTGSWSANVATISGTPTASGTFNYTVTMTGGCTGGTNTATGTITVNPNNTIAAGVNRTTCINTAITSISLATTGATGATFSGLPAGVTGSWSANVATISGTPTASGTFNYTVTMTGGCTGGTNTATGTITVNAAPVAYIIPRGGDSVGCTNDEFVLETSVSGGGGGSPSYQWYEYDFGTSSYTLISGATSDTFKTAPLTNTSGSLNKIYRYKVEYNVSGSGCTTGIDEVDITILPTPSLTSTMEDCAGTASGGEWDYVYTTATLGSGPYSVADSTGGSVVVFASPGDVLKIFRVPMGTGSHNFAVTDANGCMAVSTLSANASLPNTLPNTGSAGNASGQCILKGFNEWVHIRKEFSASEVIASVKDNGVDLGTVTVESYREATSPTVPNSGAVCVGTPVAAMRRHFVVKSGSYSDPSVKFQDLGGNPTDVSLRLYFSQDDFDTLVANTAANNVSGNRCTEDDDITSMNALYLTKYSDYALLGNEDGDYLNNSTNSAYYRVFNVGNITNPMLIKQNGFDTIFGTTGSTFHYAELNVSEFSELWLHGSNNGTPLPVEMLFIEAKNMNNEYIKINWATATELNNMRFDVERSTDGEHFTKIGEVQGNGTSTERHDYSYSDKDVTAGIRYYYRLKQIDFDEKYEYSPVVSEMLRGEDLFRVSEFVPNPAADQAKLFITTGTEQEITIEVNNYMGEVVKKGATYLNKGSNTINFDFGDLAAGTYTTRVVAGANTYVRRIIITR